MAWDIVYYKAADGSVPAEDFLDGCPDTVEAKLEAVLSAVAEAPPPQFSGGGMWEAMHGEMGGYYEVRVTGPGREHFRLFCLLDRGDHGLPGPAIVVLDGLRKPHMTTFSKRDYEGIRRLGDDYVATSPRRIAT
jgi:hypothetical protein